MERCRCACQATHWKSSLEWTRWIFVLSTERTRTHTQTHRHTTHPSILASVSCPVHVYMLRALFTNGSLFYLSSDLYAINVIIHRIESLLAQRSSKVLFFFPVRLCVFGVCVRCLFLLYLSLSLSLCQYFVFGFGIESVGTTQAIDQMLFVTIE